jgi:hypothetical protein
LILILPLPIKFPDKKYKYPDNDTSLLNLVDAPLELKVIPVPIVKTFEKTTEPANIEEVPFPSNVIIPLKVVETLVVKNPNY